VNDKNLLQSLIEFFHFTSENEMDIDVLFVEVQNLPKTDTSSLGSISLLAGMKLIATANALNVTFYMRMIQNHTLIGS
jgi:hypothetical protein